MTDLFFILAMGRSGTKFFSRLLSTDPRAIVQHEPWAETDLVMLPRAVGNYQQSHGYIAGYRSAAIKAHTFLKQPDVYGEVNSHLRYHAKAIREVFPDAKLIHLVRDGRDVVRSLMPRGHYREQYQGQHGRGHLFVKPPEGAPLAGEWDTLTRFEKCAWLWADANRYLRQHVDYMVSAEALWQHYDYFAAMCDYIDVDVGKVAWQQAVDAPVNATTQHVLEAWPEWDDIRMAQFDRIAGEEMVACGYYD